MLDFAIQFDQPAEEYLKEKIFPSLLPAIEALLKAMKKRDPTMASPPGAMNPSIWLAHYLYRHNAKRGAASLLPTSSHLPSVDLLTELTNSTIRSLILDDGLDHEGQPIIKKVPVVPVPSNSFE